MRLAANSNDVVHVVLSERNLLSLLHKAGRDESYRTLTKRESLDATMLIVTVESDDEHYEGIHPGVMDPATEDFLAKSTVGSELAEIGERLARGHDELVSTGNVLAGFTPCEAACAADYEDCECQEAQS